MDTYSILREFADSWMLLAMFLFFLGVIVWVFRPGARATYDDIARIPFRNDEAADEPAAAKGESRDA
ncbi:MAG: cbb3-type cytochrome c oxidase subunit 3 [Pseudomonadota bacterium]